ncbi:hypothetical protein LIER_37065 [Lithospermum erythrorhizon]|uniref:Integrase catalytic domain-containing protein n=1 Tax=Lithospermum erythrorhizon TaxID=34254 RepID=A0AAV3PEJ9_LITER
MWSTLYFLQGAILRDFATTASSDVDKEDMAKLWHLRLGHMSERGMQILAKDNLLVKKIKRLRTDNGLEFYSSEFDELCMNEGIVRHHIMRYTSQQNVVVERMNQALLERARCMLSHAGLEKKFWTEAENWSQERRRNVVFDENFIFNSTLKTSISEDEYGVEKQVEQRIEASCEITEEVDPHEPSSYKEVVTGIESIQWLAAMGEEIESLQKNRLGSWQEDHRERVLLAIVAHQELEFEQLDVQTTFLHGDLEEEIYMTQPVGFRVPEKEDYVCKLKKSLYGLKQFSRQWYKRFDSYMLEIGYLRSPYDSCVYYNKFKNGSFIYLVLYVDDMLLSTVDKSNMQRLKRLLSVEFDMKDLGAAKKIM